MELVRAQLTVQSARQSDAAAEQHLGRMKDRLGHREPIRQRGT
jgi:hypothetical protein